MGDTGSMLLGTLLAGAAITGIGRTTQPQAGDQFALLIPVAIPILVLALPGHLAGRRPPHALGRRICDRQAAPTTACWRSATPTAAPSRSCTPGAPCWPARWSPCPSPAPAGSRPSSLSSSSAWIVGLLSPRWRRGPAA